MKLIRVVIDAKLWLACDRAAKKASLSRSELVRRALREHLQRVQIQEFEQCDQRGYEMIPQSNATEPAWETEAAWPEGRGFRS